MDKNREKVIEFLREGYHCYENDATESEKLWLVEEIRAEMEGNEEFSDEELAEIVANYTNDGI